MASRCILLAAGGTGGHMFPAQALAAELARRDWVPALVTDARGLALAKDFPASPIEVVDAATISPRNPFKAAAGAVKIASGVARARALIKRLNPSAVVGFGGYPSIPALFAARRRIPIILHEQNAVLGRANRLFAKDAHVIASGFTRLERLPQAVTGRWVITGNPVRAPFVEARDAAYAPLPERPVHVFVLGGSLGARILSEIVPRAVQRLPEELRARLTVVQQTRQEWITDAEALYAEAGVKAVCQPFFDDVAARIAASDLVIARAGASSVTEIAVVGRASILVPLGIAMDDHQSLNARALAEVGAADVIAEGEFDGQRLRDLLAKRLNEPADLARRAAAARAAGRPDATLRLADCVEEICAKSAAAA